MLLLVMGEFFCRIFLDINYVGVSKNSFTPKAFGESHGNAKNVKPRLLVSKYTPINLGSGLIRQTLIKKIMIQPLC